MNNIAIQNRINGACVEAPALARQMATVLATVLLSILMISFRPFQPAGAELTDAAQGDIVNQIGFGAVGLISLIALLTLTDRRRVAALVSPWWLLLLGFLCVSILNTPTPSETMRSAIFSVIGIAAAATVIVIPRNADALSRVLLISSLTVLGLSYAGLLLFPEAAIHQPGGAEAQHTGLWRGVFTHKNIAGPVMACLSFAGLYLLRRGWRAGGWIVLAAAMIFLINTGSKTTAATVPLAGLMVMAPGLMGLRRLTPLLVTAALLVTATATLGMVFLSPIQELAAEIAPGLTYTGRTSLWAFMGEMIAERPWIGYGFENFWSADIVLGSDQPFDRDWDIRGIIHGHNSYLDLAIAMGLPALFTAVCALVAAPLRDYRNIPLYRENVLLADLFMMILAFTLLNGFLESFFFRRADPVWLLLVIAALGLRLTARFPLAANDRH